MKNRWSNLDETNSKLVHPFDIMTLCLRQACFFSVGVGMMFFFPFFLGVVTQALLQNLYRPSTGTFVGRISTTQARAFVRPTGNQFIAPINKTPTSSRWWLNQTIWKIWVKLDLFFSRIGVKITNIRKHQQFGRFLLPSWSRNLTNHQQDLSSTTKKIMGFTM